jgi:hypothetical protein
VRRAIEQLRHRRVSCSTCVPLQRGHIHDTFVSTWRQDGGNRRYLHQRMNDKVFQDIPAVMHNIETREPTTCGARWRRPHLNGFPRSTSVPTRERRSYLVTKNGPWRTYLYIEGCSSFDHCSEPRTALSRRRGRSAGSQSQLADLDAS